MAPDPRVLAMTIFSGCCGQSLTYRFTNEGH
jgi:hypothetical protein